MSQDYSENSRVDEKIFDSRCESLKEELGCSLLMSYEIQNVKLEYPNELIELLLAEDTMFNLLG